ncbi:MAG: undecaprenyl-diphosphatase UppP [Anaerolineales bacterium]
MTVIQSILLGIVQGITEFLPISSSGHLVIVPFLLKWEIPPAEAFVFDVLVQVATLIAVLAFFWKDFYVILRGVLRGLRRRKPFETQPARMGWYILLSAIPAGIAGLFLKDVIEAAFSNPRMTGIALLATALLLVIAERVGRRQRILESISWVDALIIGVYQILALFPGLSRSGSTIAGGMTRDLNRPSAARFSFLMAVPIMLAAGLSAVIDLLRTPNLSALLPVFIPGFIAAAVVGYLAIGWLISFLTRYSLYYFAIYCAIMGLIVLLVLP